MYSFIDAHGEQQYFMAESLDIAVAYVGHAVCVVWEVAP